jgi:hypothetical protein
VADFPRTSYQSCTTKEFQRTHSDFDQMLLPCCWNEARGGKVITDWRQPSLLLSRMSLGDSCPDRQERVAAHKNAPFPSFLEQLCLCLSFGMTKSPWTMTKSPWAMARSLSIIAFARREFLMRALEGAKNINIAI